MRDFMKRREILSRLLNASHKKFYELFVSTGFMTKEEAIQDLKQQQEEILETLAWLKYAR